MLEVMINAGKRYADRNLGVYSEDVLRDLTAQRAALELARIQARIPSIKKNFNLYVEMGGIVLITGNNHSGKSSLLSAIAHSLGYANKTVDNYWAEDVFRCRFTANGSAIELPEKQEEIEVFYYDFDKNSPSTVYGANQELKYKECGTGSHREVIEKHFKEKIRQERTKPCRILFLDEPETGMDCNKQKNIEKWLKSYVKKPDMAIVATNCLVLKESKLPRVDLSSYSAKMTSETH